MAASAADIRSPPSTLSLPDFCGSRAVLAVVLIVEPVAILYATAPQALHGSCWLDAAARSLVLLWSGLTCCAVHCRARPWLHTMSASCAAPIALAMLVASVGAVSEVVFQVGQFWARGFADAGGIFPT